VTVSAVGRVLKNRGVKARSLSVACRRYQVDENYFEKIDSHEKAQILGMLYADGCNMIEHGELNLGLQKKDAEYLEWVKKCIKSNRPIRFVKKKGAQQDQYHLRVNSKKICQDLSNLGCVPRKSLILVFPSADQVPDEFVSSFILGYLEGDGSVNLTKKMCKAAFYGSDEFIKHLHKYLTDKLGIYFGYEREKSLRCSRITTQSPKNIVILMNWLYSNCAFKMQRKYDKFKIIESCVLGGFSVFPSKRSCENDDRAHQQK
jgi:hypothetical protein